MNASEMCTCPTKKQTTANVDVDVRAKQIESPKAAQTNSSFTKNIASNICSTFAAFSINILVFFFNLTVFLKKWANPASFSFIFGLFKQTIQFLQQINVIKCHVHPVSGAGI